MLLQITIEAAIRVKDSATTGEKISLKASINDQTTEPWNDVFELTVKAPTFLNTLQYCTLK